MNYTITYFDNRHYLLGEIEIYADNDESASKIAYLHVPIHCSYFKITNPELAD